MSLKLKCHQNWNVTKIERSPKLKCQKTEMSQQLKCHQNWNVAKTEMSPKLKCYQNWNVTITKILHNLKMSLKSKSIIKSNPGYHLVLVSFINNTTIFSLNRPTGPIRSSSRDVCVSVCLSVCLFDFPIHVVYFEAYF